MKVVHAITLLILSALVVAMVACVATASTPGMSRTVRGCDEIVGAATIDLGASIPSAAGDMAVNVKEMRPNVRMTTTSPGKPSMAESGGGAGYNKSKATARPTAMPTVMPTKTTRYLQMRNPQGVRPLAVSPTPTKMPAKQTVRPTVTPVAKVSVTPTPTGGPIYATRTPPPGSYTPRFPGEPGYKGSPTPTMKPTATPAPRR